MDNRVFRFTAAIAFHPPPLLLRPGEYFDHGARRCRFEAIECAEVGSRSGIYWPLRRHQSSDLSPHTVVSPEKEREGGSRNPWWHCRWSSVTRVNCGFQCELELSDALAGDDCVRGGCEQRQGADVCECFLTGAALSVFW